MESSLISLLHSVSDLETHLELGIARVSQAMPTVTEPAKDFLQQNVGGTEQRAPNSFPAESTWKEITQKVISLYDIIFYIISLVFTALLNRYLKSSVKKNFCTKTRMRRMVQVPGILHYLSRI
jgi:hypothetical protein